MALNVDPTELVSSAAQLASTALGTAGAVPGGWVVPAGADPISAQAVPALNAQWEQLANNTTAVLRGVHHTAGNIGAAAANYTAADAQGGTMLGGSGGDTLANPVAPVADFGQRAAPAYAFPEFGESIDPLTFAHHLHSGPGPGPAGGFASDIRQYLGGAHTDASTSVTDAIQAMQNWTPHGEAAAAVLSGHASDLDILGAGLQDLIDSIETYGNAFQTAKATHPTPQEIIEARKELLAAMRSKNEPGILAASAKLEEQNARSSATIGNYAGTVGAKTSQSAASSNAGSSSGDTSALTSMLPMLMSMMNNGNQGLSGQDQNLSAATDGLSSDNGVSIPDLGGTALIGDAVAAVPDGGSVGDATSSIENVALGAMPMVAAAASLNSGSLPSAAVSEPLSAAAVNTGAAAARAENASGMPYMPMMPGGMGGAGGAGGAERSRVVAWHPDRLMYVDNTPHTEQVIGEKPTIAPTITPPTPLNHSPSGGTT